MSKKGTQYRWVFVVGLVMTIISAITVIILISCKAFRPEWLLVLVFMIFPMMVICSNLIMWYNEGDADDVDEWIHRKVKWIRNIFKRIKERILED